MASFDFSQVTPQSVLFAVLALVAAWLAFKATKQLLVGAVSGILALAIVGYLTGVVSPGRVAAVVKSAQVRVLPELTPPAAKK